MQKLQVNNVFDSKHTEILGVNASGHITFPPNPPDVSLHRKIINDFCDAVKPSKFEVGCAMCGALTLQTELSDLNLFKCVKHYRALFYLKRT